MRTTYLLPVFMFLFTQTAFAQYDETFYTVTAPSGLTLREGPGIEYERLSAISFATQLTLLDDEWLDTNRDTINEIAGHWVPVQHEQQEGYVFSAYLKWGHLFRPAEEAVNRDFRVAIPGMRFSALNYDPELTWYALVAEAGAPTAPFRLEPATPTVNYEPLTYEETFNWGDDGLVSIDLDRGEDFVALLIGTKTPIAELETLEQFTYYNPEKPYDWGRPVYPFQQLDLFKIGSAGYSLSGHVDANSEASSEFDALNYHLGISKNRLSYEFYVMPQQVASIELSPHGYQPETTEVDPDLNFSNHPRIFWRGDVNGDTVPDLLFYQPNISECCGGSEAYFLLLSTQNEAGDWKWKRAAYDVLESIGGC